MEIILLHIHYETLETKLLEMSDELTPGCFVMLSTSIDNRNRDSGGSIQKITYSCMQKWTPQVKYIYMYTYIHT